MCCKQKHGRKREALPLCICVFVSVSLFLVRLICIYVFEVADCSDVLMPEIFLNSLASVLTATFPKFCCSVFLHESLELLIVEIWGGKALKHNSQFRKSLVINVEINTMF